MKKAFSVTLAIALMLSFTNVMAQKAVTFNQQFTFTKDDFPTTTLVNPCTKESVTLDGSVHVVIHGVINNNKISLALNANFQHLTGKGTVSENQYAGGGAANAHLNDSFNGAFNGHLVASTVLTTRGKDNNLFIKAKLHITVNANGDVTAKVADVTVDCK